MRIVFFFCWNSIPIISIAETTELIQMFAFQIFWINWTVQLDSGGPGLWNSSQNYDSQIAICNWSFGQSVQPAKMSNSNNFESAELKENSCPPVTSGLEVRNEDISRTTELRWIVNFNETILKTIWMKRLNVLKLNSLRLQSFHETTWKRANESNVSMLFRWPATNWFEKG